MLNRVSVVCNDERTRTFVCLEIDPSAYNGRTHLNELVGHIDHSLNAYNLPPFYEVHTYFHNDFITNINIFYYVHFQNAMFHVSILWCLGDRKSELEQKLDQLQTIFNEHLHNDENVFVVNVDRLYIKIGNKLFTFVLHAK